MKLYSAYGAYLLSLSTIVAISTIFLGFHDFDLLTLFNGQNSKIWVHVDRPSTINLFKFEDFDFLASEELAQFRQAKKQRAQIFFEQLCGYNQSKIKSLRNVSITHVLQFVTPQHLTDESTLLVKQLAMKQLTEQKITPQISSMIAALEKLLE